MSTLAPPAETRTAFRINPELIVSFAGGEVTLTVPGAHRTLRSDAATLGLLAAASDPNGQALAALTRDYTPASLEEGLMALADAGILVEANAPAGLAEAWRDWGEPAWFLHLASRDTRFAIEPEEQLAMAAEVGSTPPPPRYKCLCRGSAGTVALPRPRPVPAGSFSEVLLRRRTCRHFADAPLRLQEVADLAFYTGGVLFENDTRYFGTVLKKCAPSPGARHGTEMYLVLRRCEGAEPGVYHYCVRHHCLNKVSAVRPEEFLPAALVRQDYFAAAPLVVFFTCVVGRLMWKYKGPRIYRLAHIEAGHYCQNFLLTGTALGLGVFCTGALAESVIEPVLGIDGVEEIALYTAGAGPERGEPYCREGVRLTDHLPPGQTPRLPGVL
jgi:SagB-type dehydrogenase family enzyme